MNHLAALQVIVPLLAAPVCVMLRTAARARAFATFICLVTFAIAWQLTAQVTELGPLSYWLGGWEPPWGIELRADAMTALLLLVTTGIAAVVSFTGVGDNSHGITPGREALFYAAYLLCLSGLVGMTMAGDAFNVFVFLEISSLSTYTLVALGRGRRAVRAALSYLMMGTVGGTFYLLGVGMLYQLTGSLNMEDIARILPGVSSNRALLLAVTFLLGGLGLKVALFPLHQWLPNAYAYAPSATSSFVAGAGTKVIYYLMLRLVFGVFGASLVLTKLGVVWVLLPLAVLGMFAGSLAAIFQKDLKRLLAYSSVAQLGYLVLALCLGTEKGVQAGLIHVLNHAVMKAGLFLVAAAILARVGTTSIAELRGLGRKMPLTMAGLVVGGLGLIGVPGTAGFISKWYLVLAALDSGDLYIAGLVLLSSLLAVVYVWRLVEVIYFQPTPASAPDSATRSQTDADSPRYLIPAWALLLASVYFGFFTSGVVSLSGHAAARVTLPVDQQVATRILSGHGQLRHGPRFDAENERAAEAKSRAAAERDRTEPQP